MIERAFRLCFDSTLFHSRALGRRWWVRWGPALCMLAWGAQVLASHWRAR